jgi:ParB-like chromosome segregation protein Spo0J
MKHYQHEIKKVSDLIPYINNSRTHSDEQTTQIASSIKEFGFTNPVLIDELGGLIAGHGRLMAAKKLDLKEVPCIVLSGLTEAQKKAYIIADNQLPQNAGWDLDKLKLEIDTLSEMDFDIDLLGFSEVEIDAIIGADIDMSMLDELDDVEVDELESNVKKAIQIEFEAEDYDEARELVKYWRDNESYIGMMLIDCLRKEKDKL